MQAREIDWRKYESCTDRIAIVPIGSCEQHGHHLPLGTDTVIATEISKMVANRLDAIVFPSIPFGARSAPFSGGGPTFPGTIDISAGALTAVMADLLWEITSDGFDKILIISAHFENQAPIIEAIHSVIGKLGQEATIILSNWWDGITIDLGPDFKSWDLEHAALTETSLMLALEPNLVDLDKVAPIEGFEPPPYIRFPLSRGDIPESGALASAAGATAELGKQIAEAAVDSIIQACEFEFGKGK